MPIRDYSQPAYMGISPQLSDILLKNGMRAHVQLDTNNKLQLVVQGHDSPTLTYPVTEAQVRTLSRMGGATGSDLKAAYRVFTSIVGKDFHMPVDLTHAKNVNNRVSMGLHGYRMGYGEPGTPYYLYRPTLGWTPAQQGGYHLRRMAGTVFYGGGPYVPDRPGGRVKPGELAAGGYGFYWKGTANGQPLITTSTSGSNPTINLNQINSNPDSQQQQLLEELSQITLQPASEMPKPKKYSQEITSDVYFTTDKFLEILTSHGIMVDKDAKTMTIRSEAVSYDMEYTLSEKDMEILTSDSLKNHPMQERIDLINNLYGKDFKQKLTFEELDSDRPLMFEVGDHVAALAQSTGLSSSQANNENNEVATNNVNANTQTPEVNNGTGNTNANANTNGNNNANINTNANANDTTNQANQSNETTVVFNGEEPINLQYQYGNNAQFYSVSQQGEPQLVAQQITPQMDRTTPIYVPESHEVDAGEYYRVQADILHADPKQVAQINGEDINFINPEKGWYREGKHGREVNVEQIIVYPVEEDSKKEKYRMTAVINGEIISHDISKHDYNKFIALDDLHRMKLFSKIFPEVDLKDHYQTNIGTKIAAGIAAGLTVASEVMRPMPPYGGHVHGPGSVYFKPGVDTPSDIAHRAFEAGMNAERMEMDNELRQGW